MITAAHVIVFSADAPADRAFLRDLLGTPAVDAGDGWLILALPPAELAVHPTAEDPRHELYLMCSDIDRTVADLRARGVTFEGGVTDQGWGRLTTMRLPGGGAIGLYEPRHPVAAGLGGPPPQ
jgi:catechol 2,3-dioxygenase-like lactoylglutathione lyase family enzyme